jgi:hypothetical protein
MLQRSHMYRISYLVPLISKRNTLHPALLRDMRDAPEPALGACALCPTATRYTATAHAHAHRHATPPLRHA